MKNLIKIFTGILVLSLALAGCKKDKDKGVSNYFKVNGTTYALAEGVLENEGTSESYEGYNLYLTLLSNGFTVDENDDWTGSGKVILFELYSISATSLPSGNYDFDDVTSPSPTFSFDWGMYALDLVLSPPSGTGVDLVSGTLTVVKDGSSYDITLKNCEDEDGNTITAHFAGTLQYFDLSKKSAKTRFNIF
jgi:hypothetical protein